MHRSSTIFLHTDCTQPAHKPHANCTLAAHHLHAKCTPIAHQLHSRGAKNLRIGSKESQRARWAGRPDRNVRPTWRSSQGLRSSNARSPGETAELPVA